MIVAGSVTRKLEKWCRQAGEVYFRPYFNKGDPSKAAIFLSGINPATPFTPEDYSPSEYAELFLDPVKFKDAYEKKRSDSGKKSISATRKGMDDLTGFIIAETEKTKSGRQVILEADVVAYPARDIKSLKKVPESVRRDGREIFFELFNSIKPGLLILHGMDAVEYFLGYYNDKNNIDDKFSVIEKKRNKEALRGGIRGGLKTLAEKEELEGPAFTVRFDDKHTCDVFIWFHLWQYNGPYKKFYKPFLTVLERYIKKHFN
jgi:hypothetical protein